MPVNIINRDYYGAAQRGREDRLNETYAQQRNQLGQMDVQKAQAFNALSQNPNATAEQFARIGRSDISNSLQNQQQYASGLEMEKQKRLFTAAQYAIQSPSPKEFLRQNFPDIAAMNPTFEQEDDNQIRQQLQGLMAKAGSQAGIAPAAPVVKWQEKQGPRGSIIQVNPITGEQKQVIAPDNSQPSASGKRFRALRPDEVASYGLSPGTSAQINDETGQVQVLNKPSVAPQQTAAERKAVLEAKVKMPRVNAAMRRAERLAEAVKSIGGNTFLDGGPADAKALQYTEQGRELMAAAAQLMPELQALTRVPGIGSQSDLEARLASLALPSLEMDPATNARSMAELQAFIQDLRAAYETMATGQPSSEDVPADVGPAVAAPSSPTLDDIRKKYGR